MSSNNTLKHAIKKVSKAKNARSAENEFQEKNKATISRLELIRDAHGSGITKNDDASDRMEDYLEVIYELIQQKGYATSIDIAECLNVSQPSVTKMMRRLDGSGLINYEKYRGIKLTERGTVTGRDMHKRHSIVSEFLKMIGVDEDIAHRDAEEIEHHVRPETLRKLQGLIESVKNLT
jgi:Mn-dependent DtxR family transcriptional regulator